MATAASAAAAIDSVNFQSASSAFNVRTPFQRKVWLVMCAAQAIAKRREQPAASHTCVFYRTRVREMKLRVAGVHRVAQHANTGNSHLYRVARKQRPHTCWRTGGDHVAG